jgi:hypothetical protein
MAGKSNKKAKTKSQPLIAYTPGQRFKLRDEFTGLEPEMLATLSRFAEKHKAIWTPESYKFLRGLLDGELAKTQESMF